MYNLFVLCCVGGELRLWSSVCEFVCTWDREKGGKWEREYVWLCWYAGGGGRSLVWPLKIPHLEITYGLQTAPTIFSCSFYLFYSYQSKIIHSSRHLTTRFKFNWLIYQEIYKLHMLYWYSRMLPRGGHPTSRPLPETKAAHLALKPN